MLLLEQLLLAQVAQEAVEQVQKLLLRLEGQGQQIPEAAVEALEAALMVLLLAVLVAQVVQASSS